MNPANSTSATRPRAPFSAWLAWAVGAFGVGLALYGPARVIAGGAVLDPSVVAGSGQALYAVVFCVVGALIVSRQRRNTIGWLLLVAGYAFAFGVSVLDPWSQSLPASPTLTGATLLVLWLSGWTWWLLIGPLLLIALAFPTGRLPSPRWRWVVVLLAASFAAFLLGATHAATVTLPNATEPVRNPLGFVPDALASIFLLLFQLLLPAAAVGSVAAIFVRYRRATAVERQQIKWFLYACAFFVTAFVLQFFFTGVGVVEVLFALAIPSIPIAIGIAILRYRLWDIDVIIRRTLIYAVLTALLALAYFGSVVVLQNTIGALTGQRGSTLVTVLSTLVIAALFVPLRRRVQAVIDQRFYRRKYDATRTLAAFGARLRDETNLDQLTAHLTDVVDETMHPASLGLWLRPRTRE